MKPKQPIDVVILLTMLCLIACGSIGSQNKPPKIDEFKDLSVAHNKLSSWVKAHRIIKLETTPECLIGEVEKIAKNNSTYYVKSSGDELFQFNNEGDFIQKIGQKGKGPGEYYTIKHFAINKDGSVLVIGSLKDLFFYKTTNGDFIKKITIDSYISSVHFIGESDLIVQVNQSDFLLAQLDSEGNIIQKYGKMSKVMELETPIEFIELNESNIAFRIGFTSEYYNFNTVNERFTRKKFFSSRKEIEERELHDFLNENEPNAYYAALRNFNSYYRLRYLREFESNTLLFLIHKGIGKLVLFNPKENIKKQCDIYPLEASNLIDDVTYLPSTSMITMFRSSTDDNSILYYVYAQRFLKSFEESELEELKSKDGFREIQKLLDSTEIEDNPVFIELFFEEI